MKQLAAKEPLDKSDWSVIFFTLTVVLCALVPTLMRLFVYGFYFSECWLTLLMDLGVCAVLAFVFITNPFRYFLIWSGLFVALLVAYLMENMPQDFWEWFGTAVVFWFLWRMFPLLHWVAGYYLIGLFIGYVYGIRIYGLQLDKDIALRELENKSPSKAVSEGLDKMFGFGSRYSLARERARWYVYMEDGELLRRLRELTALAKEFNKQLAEQGLHYVKVSEVPVKMQFSGSDMEVRLTGECQAYTGDGSEVTVLVEASPALTRQNAQEHWLLYQIPNQVRLQKKS